MKNANEYKGFTGSRVKMRYPLCRRCSALPVTLNKTLSSNHEAVAERLCPHLASNRTYPSQSKKVCSAHSPKNPSAGANKKTEPIKTYKSLLKPIKTFKFLRPK